MIDSIWTEHAKDLIAMREELARLRAEVAALKNERDELILGIESSDSWTVCEAPPGMVFMPEGSDEELARLRVENAELREDAERYRWLLQHALYEVGSHGDLKIDYSCDFEHWNDVSASIDAARKEEQK